MNTEVKSGDFLELGLHYDWNSETVQMRLRFSVCRVDRLPYDTYALAVDNFGNFSSMKIHEGDVYPVLFKVPVETFLGRTLKGFIEEFGSEPTQKTELSLRMSK